MELATCRNLSKDNFERGHYPINRKIDVPPHLGSMSRSVELVCEIQSCLPKR